jgi:hypothetical protein
MVRCSPLIVMEMDTSGLVQCGQRASDTMVDLPDWTQENDRPRSVRFKVGHHFP